MRPTKDQCIALSAKQKGYKAPGPGKKNKYASWFDSKMPNFFNYRKNGVNVDWCAIFVCWLIAYLAKTTADACYVMCTPKNSCAAGVGWLWKYFKAKGRTTKTAGEGYVIFLNKLKHVGFVYKVDSTYVYYRAGNEGGGHGEVKEHKLKKTSTKIYGYGRPRYK